MNRKIALVLLLNVCVILAILLVIGAMTPLVAGVIFAVVLVVLGVLSKGYRRTSGY